jgi:hypothetical protein
MAKAEKMVSIRLEADDYQFLSRLAEAEKEDLSTAVRDLIGRGRVFLGLRGAGAPRSRPSVERSSSMSGQ